MSRNDEVVSVVVITYNSAMTVLETLDSIKNQDYDLKNIDLIITDDASTDPTVKVVNSWLDDNRFFFNSARIITHGINGGIAKNCNSGWRACNTTWIKTIAGDDLLAVNCLSELFSFIERNENSTMCVFSKVRCFGRAEHVIPYSDISDYVMCSPNQQFFHLLVGNFLPAPSSFIQKNALEIIGYCDESFTLIEDYPLWLKMTVHGINISYLDMELVKYRVANSITSNSSKLINVNYERQYVESYIKVINSFAKDLFIARLLKYDRVIQKVLRYFFGILVFKNKDTKAARCVLKFVGVFSLSYVLNKMRSLDVKLLKYLYFSLSYRSSLKLSRGE